MNIELGLHCHDAQIDLIASKKVIVDVLDELGIEADVSLSVIDSGNIITVNGVVCCLPDKLQKQIKGYIQVLEKKEVSEELQKIEWGIKLRETIFLHAPAFFSVELLPEYFPAISELEDESIQEIRKQCYDIIVELLNLKISLKYRNQLAEISHNFLLATEIRWDDFREELIASLSGNEIALFFNRDYFEQMISSTGKNDLFELMRIGLFYENGIQYPSIQLYFDESLPFNTYCFQFNSYKSFPHTGLIDTSQMVVNVGAEKLAAIGIQGTESVNPAYGNPVTLIDVNDRNKLDSIRSASWEAFGYFVVYFSVVLRSYAHLFVNQKLTRRYLRRIKTASPKIVSMIEQQKLVSFTSGILRLLAHEGISIQHHKLILEAILDRECIVADGRSHIIFDERIPVYEDESNQWRNRPERVLEFVRMRLKRKISHKYSLGTGMIDICLLDSDIESKLYSSLEHKQLLDADSEMKIRTAILKEVAEVFNPTQIPVILTTVDIRYTLRKLLEPCYREIAVLSYQELTPETNINTLSRICLDE